MSDKRRPTSLWTMVLSVLASAFGVQSRNNYERDFNNGKLAGYIVIGVVFVGLLIAALAGLVSVILH